MRPAILLAAAALVLLGGYIGLCASVHGDTVLPKTRIVYPKDASQTQQWSELSGLTREEVLEEVQKDFHQRYDGCSVQVRACGEEFSLPVGNTLELDAQDAVDQAFAPVQAPFLFRGVSRLRSLFLWQDVKLHPQVRDAAALRSNMGKSGLLEADTTVYTTYEVNDEKLVFHKGRNGQRVDEDALVQQVTDAVHSGKFGKAIESAVEETDVNDLDWSEVEKKVCRKSKNANLKLSDDRRDYELVEARSGISLDRNQAREALESAQEGSDAQVELRYEKPAIDAEELKAKLFKDKLGTYTTTVTGTANRISNVRLAAEKCNGIILRKGDKFSYNKTLGERTQANGFHTAGAYLNGKTVQELGGGICQISSTLYAAVLDANLKILERHNHTFASSYIGLGMDATVSWGGPDFRFKNDKDYPIRLEAAYSNGKATVTIWGTRTDKRTVKMVSKTEKVIPYPTVTKTSSGLKAGKTKVTQKGSDGYRVQTYREIYEGGKLVSSEKEAYSVYTPHEQIVLKGKKGSKKSSKHKKSKKTKKTKKSKKSKKKKGKKKSKR
jgi:vancomycin resistance protein YoaR